MADQLDNQSVLVLYVAGELPDGERLELERRIEADASLRDEVEALRSAHALAMGSLRSLDEAHALPESQLLAAQRNTGRVMRQWQVDRAVKKPAPPARRTMRLGWGIYSAATAAAAILVIGLYVWWENSNANDTTVAREPVEFALPADEEERLALVIEQAITPVHGEVERVEQAMTQVQLLGSADRAGRSLWELQ